MDEAKILEKHFGIWGNIRKKFMHEYREAEWELMLDAGKLEDYLTEFNERFQAEADELLASTLEKRGVTEALKEKYPMLWVQRYNLCKEEVREILQRQIEEIDVVESEPEEDGTENDIDMEDVGPELLPDAKSRFA